MFYIKASVLSERGFEFGSELCLCFLTLASLPPGPKNDPPQSVQEKVLSLIQSWAETFRHNPDMSGVSQVYADLKHKGLNFPPPDAEDTPIITPSKVTIVAT